MGKDRGKDMLVDKIEFGIVDPELIKRMSVA